MATIVTRAGKGSELTHAEVDANFTNLNTDKVEAASLAAVAISGAYADLTGIPASFTPSAHVHTIANVTGLQTALDGKQAAGSYAAAVHGHVIADVTGLQTALDGKQAAGSYQPLAAVLTATTASFTTAQESKLAGIAAGATVNAADAALRDRSTHTGTQAAGTITGLAAIATTGNAADLDPLFASTVLGNPDGISGPVQEIGFGDFGNLIPVFSDFDNGTVPASGGGGTKFLRDDAVWVVPGGGGGATYGTATIDFGAFPGSNEALVTFADTGVGAGSKVQAWIMADGVTIDHDAADHRYAPILFSLSALPTAGVGGTIYARSFYEMQGTFAVRWSWA
jgi:hypothetical protein